MFSIITYGLSVAVVGMATVFLALAILIGLVKVMERVLKRMSDPDFSLIPKKGEAAGNAPTIVIQTCEVNNDEVVAVISAAISTVLASECGSEEKANKTFVVRSIRRVSNAPAWNRAGREEQVYSRM